MPHALQGLWGNIVRRNIVCASISMAFANDEGTMIVCGHKVECTGTRTYQVSMLCLLCILVLARSYQQSICYILLN